MFIEQLFWCTLRGTQCRICRQDTWGIEPRALFLHLSYSYDGPSSTHLRKLEPLSTESNRDTPDLESLCKSNLRHCHPLFCIVKHATGARPHSLVQDKLADHNGVKPLVTDTWLVVWQFNWPINWWTSETNQTLDAHLNKCSRKVLFKPIVCCPS